MYALLNLITKRTALHVEKFISRISGIKIKKIFKYTISITDPSAEITVYNKTTKSTNDLVSDFFSNIILILNTYT